MSLQFIMGPSGAGKSHYLYQKVTEESRKHPQKNYIVLVPEQFTMQTQKDLVMANPDRGIMNVDVLSFHRLAHRIFEETGGIRQKILDDVGKSFVLRKIAGEYEGELKILGSNLKKRGYIGELKSVISEFTQYDIREEQLAQMMEASGSTTSLYYKLQDIKTIYEGFERYLQDKYITGEELLEILCPLIAESKILKDSVVVLDGFTGLTPVQNKLMRELLAVCEKVLVTVTIDAKEDAFIYRHPYQLFALSKKMAVSLVEIARECQVEIEESLCLYDKPVYRFRGNEALGFLESHLFRHDKAKFTDEQDSIRIYSAKNPKEEIDFVAQKIRSLVRTEGYRYREIAVIAGDMNVYANHMEKVFAEYEIPVFIDYKRSILLNSFVEYVRSLLGMAEQKFSYASVFRYLRTGLTSFTKEEIDIVENYVIAFGIRGYGKWKEQWIRRMRGMEENELEVLNVFREKFVASVEELMAVLSRNRKTVADITKALHSFLLKEELQKRVKAYELQFEKDGKLALAKEYAQVYRIVIELFDKFVELLGDEKISLKEYCELLDAGLEEAKVGIIPPSLDQIVVGDITRTRITNVKAVFLLGVNDMFIPGKAQSGGLLSEFDREQFEKGGVTLSPGAKEKAYIQKFYLYLLMTKPVRKLYLSYSKVSSDGKALRPAYLISDLKKMYPRLSVRETERELTRREMTEKSGITYLAEGLQKKYSGMGKEWQQLYTWYQSNPRWRDKVARMIEASFYQKPNDPLTKKTAEKLYGTVLENSVSRLERFSACAYAHFLSYGLRLSEREEYQFRPVDMGIVFHSAIEKFSRRLEREGYTWTTLTEEQTDAFIEKSVEESIVDYGNTVLYSSARNEYMITRLKRMMRRTIWALTKQLEKGDFVPSGYEISFGNKMVLPEEGQMYLHGKIDRIDVCEDGQNLYVKVIDYKTGAKVFDLGELFYGLQLQLVLYMNAALDMESKRHRGKTVIPAGIFYYQIQDPLVGKEEDEEKLEQSILKELRLDGLVNAEEAAVKHLDSDISAHSLVVPVGQNKDGSLSKASKTVSREEFDMLSKYALRQMKKIGTRILEGETEIAPYELGNQTGCDYCPYQGVCGFEEKIPGFEYRRLAKLKKEEVLRKMREEEASWE